MINFLLSTIANLFYVIGRVFEFLAKILTITSAVFYNICVTLHVGFNTKTGKKLKEVEASITKAVTVYNAATARLQSSGVKQKEENKLLDAIRGPSNVASIGKKKDDDTNS